MEALLSVISPDPWREYADLPTFWRAAEAEAGSLARPIDRAIAAGAMADRLGYAFAAGYAAAVQSLVPGLAPDAHASLAATEEGGAHPRAIRTTLTAHPGGHFTLRGHKRWVTAAGGQLFVLATTGQAPDGRSQLVLVRVARGCEGVRLLPQPPPPYVPEIPHAEVLLEDVKVEAKDVLPGEAWETWVKPFRTVEDLHVNAAAWAFLGAVGGRSGWPRELREEIVALLTTLRGLAAEDPRSALVHVALAGALRHSASLLERLEPLWPQVREDVRQRWERDLPLLQVAARARAARADKAWEHLTRVEL